MKLIWTTLLYRLKSRCTSLGGIALFALALLIAVSPFIGLIVPDAPIPIGWIDEDDSAFSAQLKENVEELEVVTLLEEDEKTLMANLQTGKIEGVFVIKKGFEEAIQSGEFEDTLKLLRSPYTTSAGVISESVGSQAMRLWLSHYSANIAQTVGGELLHDEVLQAVLVGTQAPIISMERLNDAAQTEEVTPVKDAATASMYLLAAFVCFYMLSGLSMIGRNKDFGARLQSRAFSIERYRFATGIADALFILPCTVPPLIAFGAAGAGAMILPMLIMFVLYVLAYGGIASMVASIADQTVRMLTVSVITIANVLLGSLLVKLPSTGAFRIFTYILPSRWLSSLESLGAAWCIVGLAICALVYSALPFILRRKDA